MPNRRNYSVTLPGTCVFRRSNGLYDTITITGARTASRSASDYSRVKPGGSWLPPTTYSMTEVSESKPSGDWKLYVGNVLQSHESGVLSAHSDASTLVNYAVTQTGVGETFPQRLANRSLTDLRLKMKETNGQFVNLGQAFGERAQTAALVADSLSDVARAFSALRRGRIRDVARHLRISVPDKLPRHVPSAWLQLQYGWKPLLSDVHGAVTALDNNDRDKWKVTVRASSKEHNGGTVTILGSDPSNRNYSFCDYDILHGSRCRADLVPSNSALQTAASLGLTNPASLAWELLPFSFVVDWALPIGDYFSQLDAGLGWDVLGFSQSSFTRARWNFRGRNSSTGTQRQESNWTARRRMARLNRTGSPTVPFASFPDFKDPFSSKE